MAGKVKSLKIKTGDKVSENDVILILETTAAPSKAEKPTVDKAMAAAAPQEEKKPALEKEAVQEESEEDIDGLYAGPAVRRLARELGVDLQKLAGTGRKGRIQLEDLHAYVKPLVQGGGAGGAFSLPASPQVDHSQYGEIEVKALSKIKKLSGANLQRNWIVVPHVTQFDEADITDLEDFRIAQNKLLKDKNIKVTPLAFIMKAVVAALKTYPNFNASLDGDKLILKKYFHIGVAVDTPNGLVVAVIRDVDKKGIIDLSTELSEISNKARTKGLSVAEMQGSSFTISSLGGIGGTAFTPIVNLPDVAILGVSRSAIKPVYIEGQFVPRLMLPLSLSYDHRVIDGAEGARFSHYLAKALSDIRTIIM
jgi:pyruvate dehydrogenase E2 component (dihydrolipoamide acetyltransferase)